MPKLEYEHALGMVTRTFQELELYFSIFIWGMLGRDQRVGHAVTSQLPFSRLLILSSTLLAARTRKRKVRDIFKAIVRQAADLEQKRNRIIHSAYIQMSDDPAAKMIRYKVTSKLEKGIVIQWEAVGFEQIMDVAVELRQVTQLLADFITAHRESIGLTYEGYTKEEAIDEADVPF